MACAPGFFRLCLWPWRSIAFRYAAFYAATAGGAARRWLTTGWGSVALGIAGVAALEIFWRAWEAGTFVPAALAPDAKVPPGWLRLRSRRFARSIFWSRSSQPMR